MCSIIDQQRDNRDFDSLINSHKKISLDKNLLINLLVECAKIYFNHLYRPIK